MTLNDEDMDTYVFALGTRKAMARMQKEMQDLVRVKRLMELGCIHEHLNLNPGMAGVSKDDDAKSLLSRY